MGTHGRYDGHLGAKETCTLQHSGRGNSARILQSALVAAVGKRPPSCDTQGADCARQGWQALWAGEVRSGAGALSEGRIVPTKLEAELLAFPHGKTNDIVDSISQALHHKFSGYDSSLRWVSGD